jgi:hypothetical protein
MAIAFSLDGSQGSEAKVAATKKKERQNKLPIISPKP